MTEENTQYYKDFVLKGFVELFEMSLGHKAYNKTIRGKTSLVKKVNLRDARSVWKSLCEYCSITYIPKLEHEQLELALALVQDRYKETLQKDMK